MRALIVVLALLPAAAMAADRDPPAKPGKICRTQPEPVAAAAPQTPQPQTLDRMPPAEVYYPVLRIVDGCEVPIKARDYRR